MPGAGLDPVGVSLVGELPPLWVPASRYDVTTVVASLFLFLFGTGPVRGFAVTHAIGILTTMFTAFTLTRLIVAFWVRQSRPKEIPL